MMSRSVLRFVLLTMSLLWVSSAAADRIKKRDTIASLDNKSVELRPGSIIVDSADRARDNYRAFLDLVSDDPELRAEAMRRLADLELEATETEQLRANIEGLEYDLYDSAVELLHQ